MVCRCPRKIRDLLKDLKKAGFCEVSGGKGSHRKFSAKGGKVVVILPGRDGDDVKSYLEKQIAQKIKEAETE